METTICNAELTPDEIESLITTLIHSVPKHGSKILKDYFDLSTARQAVVNWSKDNHVIKFYKGDKFWGILVFDVAKPWWSDKAFVFEICVLEVEGMHGLQREACKALEIVAYNYHVNVISAGCFFQQDPQFVTNCYKKYGYKDSYPTYTKVVKFSYDRK